MKRSMLLATMFSAVVMMVSAVFGPASESGLTPRSAEAAAGVKVTVKCSGAPETTRVENNTNRRITVQKVGSIHQPRSNEPFRVNVTLRRGASVTFESGYDANRNTLTRQYIYDNEVGRDEGARVKTSVGRFVDRCG